MKEQKPLDQTLGKRIPVDENDVSKSLSEDADETSIFPEFWLGFNDQGKDHSKSDGSNESQEKDNSTVHEPSIVFYKQQSGNMSKVLGDLTFTEESVSSPRIEPSIHSSKVDCSKDDLLSAPMEAKRIRSEPIHANLPKVKTLLGKRDRCNLEDEINSLFEGNNKNLTKTHSDLNNSWQPSLEKNECTFSFRPNKRMAKVEDKTESSPSKIFNIRRKSSDDSNEIKVPDLRPSKPMPSCGGNSCSSTRCETESRRSSNNCLQDLQPARDPKSSKSQSSLHPETPAPVPQDNGAIFEQIMCQARRLAAIFEGVVLTEKAFSLCKLQEKLQESVKFRCQNGHTFYKQVESLKTSLRNASGRKLSASTAASMSVSSDDETIDVAHQYGCWCPKCEEFYSACKQIAKSSGFRLSGKLFSKDLSFRCPAANHCVPILNFKKVSATLSCAECKKDQREAFKQKLKQEEEEQRKYISQKQEEMFRKAREEMEREMRNNPFEQTQGAYGSYPQFGS